MVRLISRESRYNSEPTFNESVFGLPTFATFLTNRLILAQSSQLLAFSGRCGSTKAVEMFDGPDEFQMTSCQRIEVRSYSRSGLHWNKPDRKTPGNRKCRRTFCDAIYNRSTLRDHYRTTRKLGYIHCKIVIDNLDLDGLH